MNKPTRKHLSRQGGYKAQPIADALHQWMIAQRQKVPDGSGTAKALDYSLKRWAALTRYLDDGAEPIDNNRVETRSDCGRWDATTGCSRARCAVVNVRPPL